MHLPLALTVAACLCACGLTAQHHTPSPSPSSSPSRNPSKPPSPPSPKSPPPPPSPSPSKSPPSYPSSPPPPSRHPSKSPSPPLSKSPPSPSSPSPSPSKSPPSYPSSPPPPSRPSPSSRPSPPSSPPSPPSPRSSPPSSRPSHPSSPPSRPSSRSSPPSSPPSPPSRPNILVLLVDDLGFGDTGPFGNTSLPTPRLDALAAGGAVLRQSLAAAAVCTPSRAALLTGRLPIRYGLAPENNEWDVSLFAASPVGLPANETTLAKLLGQHGYRRSLVGKWHLGTDCERYGDHCHHPLTHGFETFYGIPMTNLKDFGDDGELLYASAYPDTFPKFYSLQLGGVLAALFFRRRSRLLLFLALLTAAAGLFGVIFFSNWKILSSLIMRDYDVVEQPMRLKGLTQRFVAETEEKLRFYKRDGRPFFHMHSFCKLHTALAVKDEFRGRSRHGLFGDSVMEMDWAVGRILDVLRELQLDDNTFVYFTSDNGGHVEERGVHGDVQGGYNGVLKGGKGMGGMEGGIRMPTLVRYPPLIRPGAVVEQTVSQMDLLPTVMAMVGVDAAAALPDRVLDGRNMLPLLTGATQTSPHRFLFHYCKATVHSVRWIEDAKHTWKVHLFWPPWLPGTQRCPYICQCHESLPMPQPAVFDIQQDISEERPLAPGSPQYQRVLKTVLRAVEDHRAGVDQVPNMMTWAMHRWRPTLQACCEPPFCRCTDPKYP